MAHSESFILKIWDKTLHYSCWFGPKLNIFAPETDFKAFFPAVKFYNYVLIFMSNHFTLQSIHIFELQDTKIRLLLL